MKHQLFPIALLFGALLSTGDAFTLDAAGYQGGDLARDPLSLRVAGYGEMVFESDRGAPLVVTSGYESVSVPRAIPLNFELREVVKLSVSGKASDEYSVSMSDFQSFAGISTTNQDKEVKVSTSVWKTIPEPASAGLGLAGMLLLLMGRRR